MGEENLTPGAVYVQGLDPVGDPETGFQHEMVGRFAILGIADDDELDGVELQVSRPCRGCVGGGGRGRADPDRLFASQQPLSLTGSKLTG